MKKSITTLSFKNGMTNSPSDIVCSDNDLAVSVNVAYENGEFRPIQKPTELGTTSADILFVHDFADYTHYIGMLNGGLVYYNEVDGEVDFTNSVSINTPAGFVPGDGRRDIVAIGNTLVVNTYVGDTPAGMAYFLWKDGGYKYIGEKPPQIEFKASLVHDTYNAKIEGIDSVSDVQPLAIRLPAPLPDTSQNIMIGEVEKALNEIRKQKKYAFPFFVRLAYKLYDGTHIMPTAPVLMLPSVRHNHDFVVRYLEETDVKAECNISVGELLVDIDSSFADWKDIVECVDVFVSREVRNFDINGTWMVSRIGQDPDQFSGTSRDYVAGTSQNSDQIYTAEDVTDWYWKLTPELRSDTAIINELASHGNFYYIASLDHRGTPVVSAAVAHYMDEHVLMTLETQTRLEHDDYYSHCPLMPNAMDMYNGRLHLSGIRRGFYKGPKTCLPLKKVNNAVYYVEIDTPSGTRTIQITPDPNEAYGYYFYYPDPRAKRLVVAHGSNYYEYTLTKHSFLNGSYMLHLPSSNNNRVGGTTTLPTADERPEYLPNRIMVSEVNNPFTFTADGDNQVGSGKIYAIVPNTTALSEGQFGAYPLYAFTSEGIWALGVNKEGLYDEVKPLPREVLLNPEGLVQTDNAVFFASKKGLMVLAGSKAQCCSTQLMGKTCDVTLFGADALDDFEMFLRHAVLSYDYQHSRIWIHSQSSDDVYVYSIKYNCFSIYKQTDRIKRTLIRYPKTILTTMSGKVLDLDTPDINLDVNTYDGYIITRPVKFANILKLKSIDEMEPHFCLDGDSYTENGKLKRKVAVDIYGNDGLSLRINGEQIWAQLDVLGGRPWKFFTFKITLSKMLATDTFAGVTCVTQEKRGHRLHPEGDILNYQIVSGIDLQQLTE